MSTMKRCVVSTSIAIATLIAGAYAASAQVKVGALLSVTGPAAFLGDPEQKTLEMYVEEINAGGRRQRPQAAARRL